jgi:transposase
MAWQAACTRALIEELTEECAVLDHRMEAYDGKFAALAREDATRADFTRYRPDQRKGRASGRGRQQRFRPRAGSGGLADLTPRQHSTGGKTKILGISKHGNRYLRIQPIHGAPATLPHLAAKFTRMGEWFKNMLARAHPNIVVVALAAKLARLIWAVLRHEKISMQGPLLQPEQRNAAGQS